MHLEGLRLGVQFALIGGKQNVTVPITQFFAVRPPGALVGIKVFMGQKPQAISNDADRGDASEFLGLAHQPQVTVGQVAHGRDEGGGPEWSRITSYFCEVEKNVHRNLVT